MPRSQSMMPWKRAVPTRTTSPQKNGVGAARSNCIMCCTPRVHAPLPTLRRYRPRRETTHADVFVWRNIIAPKDRIFAPEDNFGSAIRCCRYADVPLATTERRRHVISYHPFAGWGRDPGLGLRFD